MNRSLGPARKPRPIGVRSILLALGCAILVACAPAGPSQIPEAPAPFAETEIIPPIDVAAPTPTAWTAPTALPGSDPVLVGAGDIASCDGQGSEGTARLLERLPGTIFTAGDNVYPTGSPNQFATCFERTWGRLKSRIRPAPGNHDYMTPGAAGYFGYFGAAAGEPGKGYYSYDIGSWHIIALNSDCFDIGGCRPGSPQEQWLRADLAAHPAACTLAYWHHARFSSGEHGNYIGVAPLWETLNQAGADVIVVGHDHQYERFAPQDAKGRADPKHGIREFVVGTGGRELRAIGPALPNSEVRNSDTFGVIKFTLHPTSYDWEFVPVDGKTFTDSGSATCHGHQTLPAPAKR